MPRMNRPLAAVALAALVVACEPARSPSSPDDPRFALGTFNPLPQPGDGQADEEEFELCKVGGPGDFTYTVVDRKVVPNPSQTLTIHLAAGECQVIAAAGSTGNYVTVTENVADGYALDDVEITVRTGSPYPGTVFDTRHESGPTINDSIAGTSTASPGRPATSLRGVRAVYTNRALATGEIGDYVWLDANGDGIQDAGEAGLPGVTVTLGGAASATTTTDANGDYLFTGLGAGDYTVTVATPAGTTASPSGQGSDTGKDSNGSPAAVTLPAWNSVDHTIDFGFVPPPPPPSGEIGDYVWLDADGDGIQDAGESGIAGVTVTLSGPVSGTMTTDANGGYLFTGLPAGTYTVTVGTPAGTSPSPSNQGSDGGKDSNGSPASVTLATSSSSDRTIDFGFVPAPVCTPVSNPSNFNGTAVANGSTIWFNTIFKPKGVPASGGVVNFTGSSIRLTSGGTVRTISVPNARIVFSPSATSASTAFNAATNTWQTTVPVGYTGNIFLSGVGYAPPGGLPGGANPVTWVGQLTTTMPGFTMNWQWAAAVYTSFGALGSIGVKPIDGGTMNPYANSDHAGVPEAFKAFVVGGARGGGGSNWTGSYSGTVAPPVCVY